MKFSVSHIVNIGQKQRPEVESSLIDLGFRRISRYASWCFLRIGWTPNQITWLSIIVAGLGGVLLVALGTVGFLPAAACWFGFYVLDYCDGEVARCLERQTMSGNYLDYFGHYFVFISVFIGFASVNIGVLNPQLLLLLSMGGIAGILIRGLTTSLLWEVACHEKLRSDLRQSGANTLATRRAMELGFENTDSQTAGSSDSRRFIRKAFRFAVSPSGGDMIILAAIVISLLEYISVAYSAPGSSFGWAYYFFLYITTTNILISVILVFKNVRSKRVEKIFKQLFLEVRAPFNL